MSFGVLFLMPKGNETCLGTPESRLIAEASLHPIPTTEAARNSWTPALTHPSSNLVSEAIAACLFSKQFTPEESFFGFMHKKADAAHCFCISRTTFLPINAK